MQITSAVCISIVVHKSTPLSGLMEGVRVRAGNCALGITPSTRTRRVEVFCATACHDRIFGTDRWERGRLGFMGRGKALDRLLRNHDLRRGILA